MSKLVLIDFDMLSCRFHEVASNPIAEDYFAEGLSVVNNDKVYQLTYLSGDILTWKLSHSGQKVSGASLESETYLKSSLKMRQGWGLTQRLVAPDKWFLYASDSTSKLKEIDPDNWNLVREIDVTAKNGKPLPYLNELEIISEPLKSNYLFANQFQSNYIFMIDLRSGEVKHSWNMEELLISEQDHVLRNGLERPPHGWSNAVLNGIAYIPSRDSFLLSGKEWTTIYEVKLDYQKYMDI